MQGDPVPQLGHAERFGIADRVGVERALGRLDHRMGSAAARLPDLQVQHLPAGHGPLIGHAQHVERDERVDAPALRELQRHRSLLLA
jgi:hypothetical protein